MLEDKVLPQTSDEVVTLLNEVYPEDSGDGHTSPSEFIYHAGQRSVVRFLIELQKRREEALLETDI